ncbi:MAG: RluA family pseudouridine synthase [Erysipelotrichales bacterium]|nr:RluA family pseudouridine synthase [Erysipelotrichales bacterium]
MKKSLKIVNSELIGLRLDKVIVNELKEYSREFIMRLIDEEKVLVNGKLTKASYRVKESDEIELTIDEPKDLSNEPQDIPLDIIYEDEDIIVINKPRDFVVHPSNGHEDGTLVNALLHHCKDLSGINGVKRPGIVHRIDKDTTGLLVVAKNDDAHEFLASQLSDHTLHREYIALVKGVIKENDGKIIAPIGRDKYNRQKMAVDTKNGKEAVTNFHVLKRFNQYTLVSCLLETGRTHQIRVHMNYIGYPIEGDPVYGPRSHLLFDKGQLLHAHKLILIHPKTKKKMEFEAPLPDDFKDVINSLE